MTFYGSCFTASEFVLISMQLSPVSNLAVTRDTLQQFEFSIQFCFIAERWVELVGSQQTIISYCNSSNSCMHSSLHKLPAKLRILGFGRDKV